MRMKDIMTEERLLRRFDAVHVEMLLRSWDKITSMSSRLFEELDYKILFDCEEVLIPFRSLSEAPVCAMLSEGGHPTDGNDFLFLLIRQIIGRWNSLVGQLSSLKSPGEDGESQEPPIHPSSLVPGSGGSAALQRVTSLSAGELDVMLGHFWNVESQSFSVDRLESELFDRILLLRHCPPEIMNPMKYLRRKFAFRQENAGGDVRWKEKSIHLSLFGFYFANELNRVLYDDTRCLFEDFAKPSDGADQFCDNVNDATEQTDDDYRFRGVIEDTFHTLDYEQIRSFLEGVRSVLQLAVTQGETWINDNNFDEVLGRVMNLSRDRVEREHGFIFETFGFPVLRSAQAQLLLSMSSTQMASMLRWTGFQLSSEAYLFSGFPLRMKEQLLPRDLNAIESAISDMRASVGVHDTLNRVDEFARDVLTLYEGEMRKAATRTPNRNLACFLRDDNPFCDESDPIFAILPTNVRLRHYVSLRSHLHQLKLSLVYDSECTSDTKDTEVTELGDEPVEALSPNAWLWDEGTSMDVDQQCDQPMAQVDKFWFETARTEMCLHEATSGQLCEQEGLQPKVSLIQSWWRRLNTRRDATSAIAGHVNLTSCKEASTLRIQAWWRRVSRNLETYSCIDMSDVDENSAMGEEMLLDEVSMAVDGRNDRTTWTYDSLYGDNIAPTRTMYGGSDEELETRRWLNDNELPQSLLTSVRPLGARNVKDIALLVKEYPELLNDIGLTPLDTLKLKKAVNGSKTKSE